MILFPAIDLFEGKAVRLYKGDYSQMTVYGDKPVATALDFKRSGISHIHIVDLEGARSADTPNYDTVVKIKTESGLFCEIGGGIRDLDTIKKYIDAGLDRVILGTAAVKNSVLIENSVSLYADKIAVGVDIRDGFVSISGWEENTNLESFEFIKRMSDMGVGTFICTDISRDGAMRGTNLELYAELSERFNVNITASGGINGIDDIRKLREMNLYGAIIGKAYYTGAIDLSEALEAAK